MAYTKEDLESFQQNQLKKADTFQFQCAMCGNCCRKRQTPILITGADLFRMAKALNVSPEEAMAKNTICYIGDSSHCPVIVLKERDDGSCRLLRKGHCMIQQDKPTTCALYPIGRYFDVRDNSFHYFCNNEKCHGCAPDGKTWTLQEWLDEFNIEKNEASTAAWNKLCLGICNATAKMSKSKIQGALLNVILGALYLGYDIAHPYEDQVEANMQIAQTVLQEKFNIATTF